MRTKREGEEGGRTGIGVQQQGEALSVVEPLRIEVLQVQDIGVGGSEGPAGTRVRERQAY